jgi:hypothetical protein
MGRSPVVGPTTGTRHWPAPNSAFSAAQSGSLPTARKAPEWVTGWKPAGFSTVHVGRSSR